MTDTEPSRLDRAIAAIDAANAEDPHRLEYRGVSRPKELLHAELMTRWVRELDPDADEAQLLAARAHHFRRWTSPRSDHPEGRAGYLRWRTRAKQRHAEEVGTLLASHGYDDATIDRVGSIIRKEGLRTDPDVQTHEDALCLVFLDTQLDDLADQLGDDEVIQVLVKTLPKMSARGVEAVGRIELTERGASLVGRAVAARQPDPLA